MAIRFTSPITSTATRGVLQSVSIHRGRREAEGIVALVDAGGNQVGRRRIEVDIYIGNGTGDMPRQLARALEDWFFEAAAAQGQLGGGSVEDD